MEWFTEQMLLPLLGTIITGAIALAAAKITQWTGIVIEAKHREALHSALMTGARAAIKAAGANGSTGGTSTSLVTDAKVYASQSVPQALKRLNPPDNVLEDLARAKVQQVLSELRQAG